MTAFDLHAATNRQLHPASSGIVLPLVLWGTAAALVCLALHHFLSSAALPVQ